MRCGLATTLLWVGALKFKDYEIGSSASRRSPWAL